MRFKAVYVACKCVLLTFSSSLYASTCNDVKVKPGFESVLPLCQDVVIREGKEWIHIEGKFIRKVGNEFRIQFKMPDGQYSNIFRSKGSEGFSLYINNKKTKWSKLKAGQKLDFYIKTV